MRLNEFRIYNFKSIEDTGWIKLSELDNITVLAGQNESGKSAILEALDFFENGANDDFASYYQRLGTHPRVECRYLLNDEELKELEEVSGSKELKAYAKKNGFTILRGGTTKDDFAQLKYVQPDELKTITENISAPESEDAEATEGEKKPFDIYTHLLKRKPDIILYSSFNENILPSKITQAQLPENQAVKDFETVFGIKFDPLLAESNDALRSQKISKVNETASDDLNTYWTQKIGDERSEYKFKVEVHPQTAQPTESYVNFFIDQGDGFPLHVGQKSQGFKWFSGFNLRLRSHEASSQHLNELILLIDEPGQGLHEQAQEDVKKVLEELAKKGAQIIYSTHQARLLGGENIEFSRLRIVTRTSDIGTRVKTISQLTHDEGAKDALSPVRTALGLVSIDASSLSKGKVVVVEGITDYYYLQGFLSMKSVNNVTLVPCVGVSQIPNVYSILYGWGIGGKVVVDDDHAGKANYNKIKKSFFEGVDDEELSKILRINENCPGIEDIFSKNDFKKISKEFITIKNASEPNSQAARSRKEVIAKSFFDKAKTKQVKFDDLEIETKNRIKQLVDFVKE